MRRTSPAVPRRSGWLSRRKVTSRTINNVCINLLYHGILPFRWRRRTLVDELQGFQEPTAARSGTATAVTPGAPVWPSRRKITSRTVDNALHRPCRGSVRARSWSRRTRRSFNKSARARDENLCLDPRFDLVIDRPQCQHVLELPESALHVGQFLVQHHRVEGRSILLTGHDHISSLDLLFAPEVASRSRKVGAPQFKFSSRNIDSRDIFA